jgi:predicted acylesterase/phospholipase RssA
MDYFREYINKIIEDINKNKTLDFFNIITIKSDESDNYIEQKNLNSNTLFNTINLYNITYENMTKIFNDDNKSDNKFKKIKKEIIISSNKLKEDIIFFNLDVCNNFLLSNKSTNKDIQYIIKKIKKYYKDIFTKTNQIKIDFTDRINPYGIEKLVFSGGGSKGLIYLGTLLGLFVSGNIYYINYFSGTSIGGIVATLIGFITPSIEEYEIIKNTKLKDINNNTDLINRYKNSINFILERFTQRPLDTFYNSPKFTISGIYKTIKKILIDNFLYDFEDSGFGIWIALICKKICNIMNNEMDKLIIIRDNEDNIITDTDIDYDNNLFEGWKVERFITFEEYNLKTGKTLVLTGTKSNPITTVYYTHEDDNYRHMDILNACRASSCIPGVFRPVIIDGTNNIDGGLFDNFPLTYLDKKINNRITEYNNKIIGFLIDDQNTIIEPYEIIKELWLIYNGFINCANISYLMESKNYTEISELFFEIRLEIYKLIYSTNSEINNINFKEINLIYEEIKEHSIHNVEFKRFKLNNFEKLESLKKSEKKIFKIGNKTDLTDIINICLRDGYNYIQLIEDIKNDLNVIKELENTESNFKVLHTYKKILENIIQNILCYYELKGLFFLRMNINSISEEFTNIIINLRNKIIKLEKISNNAIIEINKKNKIIQIKNYIQNIIEITKTMLQKISIKITKKYNIEKTKTYYERIIEKIYNSNVTDIFVKYICIANDKICLDSINNMRTIKLNTFETNTLHFSIDEELLGRLIYEGYSKTMKYYVNILKIMEITEMNRITDEYLESYELKYKKIINIL